MHLNRLNKRLVIILMVITLTLSAVLLVCNLYEYKEYFNKETHVLLKYPRHWKLNPIYGDRYDAKDGFFMCSAAFGDIPYEKAIEYTAYHKLKPYGSNPQFEEIKVQGQKGILILLSSDQPKQYDKSAMLIMKYPTPVEIKGTVYYYFVLYADINHIKDIAKSIRFIY